MSSVTLSPPSIVFRGPSSSFASVSRYNPAAPPNNNNDLPLERRRTSHPHNPPLHPFQAAAEDMSQQPQSQSRSRLEHRASQTLIDLTEDRDISLDLPHPPQPQRPPQLGRSDGQHLGYIIDLTDDDADIQIVGARNLQLPVPVARRRPPGHFSRPESPGLFVPQNPSEPRRHVNRVFPDAAGFEIAARERVRQRMHDVLHQGGLAEVILQGSQGDNIAQMIQLARQGIPGGLDYRHSAFADRKPDHVPPEPARYGFTRSPAENDIIICPSCEQELVHNKGPEEPVVKKNGKAPSKKEREEHPFWVVKQCGHVYCNHCFQHRGLPSPKRPFNISFPDSKASGKSKSRAPLCAVEDCECDVKDRSKWVGVFL